MSDAVTQQSQPNALRRALAALEQMQARLDAAEAQRREPIAIVGIGCRFPGGASDPAAFWRLLREGRDAVTEVPPERWDIDAFYDADPDAPGKMASRWGAFLDGVDRFDPQLFGITPREAAGMDPQQRLLLEVGWEALENSGIAPDRLSGSRTGVFVGVVNSDYGQLSREHDGLDQFGPYYASGSAHSIVSGRLSYLLGLHGPSISLDTACSSSLVAVHLAVQSLRAGECQMALAGGVNVILVPDSTIAISKYRMLSPDGRCKTFDAAADGFARGEGCGVVVLKRLSDALADGDRVLAVIRGSAVNQDGASSGLTAPHGPAQEAVVREALASGGVTPGEVTYVEAHGTGTSLGDPIEVQALATVLGPGRAAERPVLIGSVKTNLGHLESAAGIAGLIKLVLCLQHRQIPPHLHLHTPNPLIPWERLPVAVPQQLTPWPAEAPLVGAVSGFGFSGTNAHVVLAAAPEAERPPGERRRPAHLLTLSAQSGDALLELAASVAKRLRAGPELALGDVAHTANAGRAQLPHRLALRAVEVTEARSQLERFLVGEEHAGLTRGRVPPGDPPRVAFLFPGQGSQYVQMGRQLYESEPRFRQTLEQCEQILRPLLERPLLSVLYPEPGEEADAARLLAQTRYTQPALFALEYALCELWRSWGIEPAAVLGHSVGEYVAACVAGVFSL
ncbi:MAG TPA: type I polyketide synthase, partial [Longimicrobiaceae bacterium]|nr:type I polyketide synthase [Longimicrobiaceae bacterium]